MTPQVRAKIEDLVATAPSSPPVGGCWCALERAEYVLLDLGDPALPTLTALGTSLLMSFSETVGVMDGWDVADGRDAVFADERRLGPKEYDEGFAFGAELHAKYGCSS